MNQRTKTFLNSILIFIVGLSIGFMGHEYWNRYREANSVPDTALMFGDPVVAPTNTTTHGSSETQKQTDFGSERYIWENWD